MADSPCGFRFNESNWGWDECTHHAGHRGDHYDSFSKNRSANQKEESRVRVDRRPRTHPFDPDDDLGSSFT